MDTAFIAVPKRDQAIRIFISSTFRDMEREREILVKSVFPRLRERCAQRGVIFREIDLRWGITDEAVSEGATVKICLDEIERCRPFFIGLLGERYGWVPAELPEGLLREKPWLRTREGLSVTALEIVEGIMGRQEKSEGVFFYLRDPAWLESASPADLETYRETDPKRIALLNELKQQIRASGYPVRENYRTPEEAAQLIETDIAALIDREFPPSRESDPVASSQASFIRERSRFWIPRQKQMRQVESMLRQSKGVLVSGCAGVGRSTFLANWVSDLRGRFPSAQILELYVGAHPALATPEGCCRFISKTLNPQASASGEQGDFPGAWAGRFFEALSHASTQGPVLLVIDGADRLSRSGEKISPEWLPTDLPENVRIVAALDQEWANELGWEWPGIELKALRFREKLQYIQHYLGDYSKGLPGELQNRIAKARATGNPYFLTLLLEELRQHGKHETLAARIDELLVSNLEHLVRLILARCERDFDGARPGLVRTVIGLIGAARLGLSEGELCAMAGDGQGPIPQRCLSPITLALRRLLTLRDGLICFDRLESGRVALEWTAEKVPPLKWHRRLLGHFQGQALSSRSVLEVFHHFGVLGVWEEFARWVSQARVFREATATIPDELASAWKQIEARTDFRVLECYSDLGLDSLPAVWDLLQRMGNTAEALKHCKETLARIASARLAPEARQIAVFHLKLGELELARGTPEGAEAAFIRAEEFALQCGESEIRIKALEGRRAALSRSMAESHNRFQRAELGRKLRALRQQLSKNKILGESGLLMKPEEADFLQRLGTDFLPGSSSAASLFERQVRMALEKNQAHKVTLEIDIERFRFSASRGVALGSALELAKNQGDPARIYAASRALQAYGILTGNHEAVATALGEMAGISEGWARLFFLEAQEAELKRAGISAGLVTNAFERAHLLRVELSQPEEAYGILRSVWQDRAQVGLHPFVVMDLRFFLLRCRLGLSPEGAVRLLKAICGIGFPIWLWLDWRLGRWVVRHWLPTEPLTGSAFLLMLLGMGIGPFFILLDLFVDCLKALAGAAGRACRPRSERSPKPLRPNSEEGQRAQPAPTLAPWRETSQLKDHVFEFRKQMWLRSQETQERVPDGDSIELPAFCSAFIGLYVRLTRRLLRVHRVSKVARFDEFGPAWLFAGFAMCVGMAMELLFWKSRGILHWLLLPVAGLGTFLLFAGVEAIFAPLASRLPPKAQWILSKYKHSVGRHSLQLGFTKLKRRWFGNKRQD